MSKIADLWAEIGFKIDTIKLHEVTKIIGDLNISSIIGATSLAALGVGIAKLVKNADESAQSLLNFKEATGIDTTRTQQVETFFQMYGAAAGDATEALHKLNTLRLQVLQGTGNPQPFILTGLSPQTETLKLLDEIHEKFSDSRFLTQWAAQFAPAAKSLEEMKRAWKEMIATQFGFSSDMLRGLDTTNAQWQKQFSLLALNQQELEKAAASHAAWVEASRNLNIEFEKMATDLTPILVDILRIVDATARWLDNTKSIRGFFSTMGRGVQNAFEIGGIGLNYAKAGLLNIGSAASQPLISASKFHHVTVTTGPITIHAKDPEDFVHRFDAVWKKEMMKELQFGKQT